MVAGLAGEAFELHLEGLELSLTLPPPGDYEGSNKWQNNDAYLDFGRVRALSHLDACSQRIPCNRPVGM